MVNMALLKKTWAEKAMTGAKLRVMLRKPQRIVVCEQSSERIRFVREHYPQDAMESGRTWNDNAGIAGGLVWMHGNSGDMDAGGWHAIGGFRARTCQRKGAYR